MKNPSKHADALRSLNRSLLKQAKPEPMQPQEPLKALVRAVPQVSLVDYQIDLL